jgi:plastocyanin
MRNFIAIILACLLLSPTLLMAAKDFTVHDKMMDHGGGHLMDMGGAMVMGQNVDRIPDGCRAIAGDKEITVHAGHKYAKDFPGRMYAFDTQEYQFEPCTRLTITFINDDNIRHQWMMHGLPKYMYPKGMFHMEVTGPGQVTGTLILPPGDKTYLVHCDLAQHMEKGMKGQLKVGKGSGDLPSIPGVTPYVIQDSYINTAPKIEPATPAQQAMSLYNSTGPLFTQFTIFGLLIGLGLTFLLAKIYKGKTALGVITSIAGLIKVLLTKIIGLFGWIYRKILSLLPSKKKPK